MAPSTSLRFVSAEHGLTQLVVERDSSRVGVWELWLEENEVPPQSHPSRGNSLMALVGRSTTAEASSWPVFKVVTSLLACFTICVLGFTALRTQRCLRRRWKKWNFKDQLSPRKASLHNSPRVGNIEFEKRNPFFRRTLIDFGYASLQPPQPAKKARTVAFSEDCWASNSVGWVPQNQNKVTPFAILEAQATLSSELSMMPKPPTPAADSNSRLRIMHTIPNVQEPSFSLNLKAHDPPSTNGVDVGASPEEALRRQHASLPHAFRAGPGFSFSKPAVGDGPSFLDFSEKVRRRPPPLAPRGKSRRQTRGIPSSIPGAHYSTADTAGPTRNGGTPVVTISDVTQTLLVSSRVVRGIDKSHVQGDSTFPTSPSPSDLGLASPFSSSMDPVSEPSSPSQRRDSMRGLKPSVVAESRASPFVTVIDQFLPTEDDEMEIRRGEDLRLLKEFQDGWCAVERISSSERGVIPRYCIANGP